MKSIIIALSILLGGSWAWGQQVPAITAKRSSVYFQYLAGTPRYSLQYDRIFSKKARYSWAYSAGLAKGNEGLGLPLGLSLLTGKEAHHAELNLTLIPYIHHYKALLSTNNTSDKYFYIVPGVGYRYQKATGGLFGRFTIAPLILLDPPSDNFWRMHSKMQASASVALGYCF